MQLIAALFGIAWPVGVLEGNSTYLLQIGALVNDPTSCFLAFR